MDKNSLRKLISDKLGVSTSKKEFAFEVFLQKIGNALEVNETMKIAGVGFFQLKHEPLLKDERKTTRGGKKLTKRTMFFSPFGEQETPDSSSLFLSFDVDLPQKDFTEFDESIFSIGIQKPVAPIFDEDENLNSLQKSIESRIDEIISASEKINDFDFFENYVNRIQEVKEEAEENLSEEMSDEEIQKLFGKTSAKQDVELPEPYQIPEVDFEEPEDLTIQNDEISDKEIPAVKEESPFDALDEINLTDEEPEEKINEDLKEEILEKKINKENIEQFKTNDKTKSEKKKEPPSFESIFENDNDLINAVLPLPEASASNDEPEIEEDEDSVEWDWGDELNAEFEEDNEDANILPSPGIEEEVNDGLTEEEKDDYDDIASGLDEEIDGAELSDDDDADSAIAKQLSGAVEKENKKTEEIQKDLKVSKKTELRSTDWKKQGYGKSFWILLGTFVVFTFFGLYYLLFWGGEKQNATDIKPILDADSVSAQADSSKLIIAKVDTVQNKDNAAANQPAATKETVKEPIKVAAVETQPVEEKTLYRKFNNEVRINNRIYSDGKRFMVQVSSFKSKGRAESDAYRFQNMGHDAFIVEANLPQLGGMWYRVRIGYFDSQKEAEDFIVKNNL